MEIDRTYRPWEGPEPDPNQKKCTFCGKYESEVFHIIDGPEVTICDECVDLCNTIITEQREKKIPEFASSALPTQGAKLIELGRAMMKPGSTLLEIHELADKAGLEATTRKKDD